MDWQILHHKAPMSGAKPVLHTFRTFMAMVSLKTNMPLVLKIGNMPLIGVGPSAKQKARTILLTFLLELYQQALFNYLMAHTLMVAHSWFLPETELKMRATHKSASGFSRMVPHQQ